MANILALSLIAATISLGIPVTVAGTTLEAQARANAAADAAALAAADAATGYTSENPCTLATQIAKTHDTTLRQCHIFAKTGETRITIEAQTKIGTVKAHARAGPPR